MKTCFTCKVPKDDTKFHNNRANSDGLQSSCKVCTTEANQKVGPDGLTKRQRYDRKAGPDGLTNHQRSERKVGPDGLTSGKRSKQKVGPDGLTPNRRYHLRANYGLSVEQFNALLSSQGNACAICRDTDKKWCVDHDHATGKVRAILCHCCNVALGLLGDSARITNAATEYLTKHGNP